MQRTGPVSAGQVAKQLIKATAKRLHRSLHAPANGGAWKDWTLAKCDSAVHFMVDLVTACMGAAAVSNVWQEIQRRLFVLQVTPDPAVRRDARAGLRNIMAQLTMGNPGSPPADVLSRALQFFVGLRAVQLTGKWPFKTGPRT